jgi:hypothetical protein
MAFQSMRNDNVFNIQPTRHAKHCAPLILPGAVVSNATTRACCSATAAVQSHLSRSAATHAGVATPSASIVACTQPQGAQVFQTCMQREATHSAAASALVMHNGLHCRPAGSRCREGEGQFICGCASAAAAAAAANAMHCLWRAATLAITKLSDHSNRHRNGHMPKCNIWTI